MLGIGQIVLRLIRARINREQQIALLHLLAFLEVHLVEITVDARSDFDGLRRFEAPDVFVPLDNLARNRLNDGHDGRRRSGLRGILPTAGQQ